MKIDAFIIPEDLHEARAALKKLGAKGFAMAGGTSLHFLEFTGKTAVDITRLGLSGIKKSGATFKIGATTTLDELMSYRGEGWVLDQVAVNTCTQQIRNISTLSGNIVRIFPWNDFPVALLALNATLHIQSKDEDEYEAEEFFKGQPLRLFKPGDLLTRVDVPAIKKGQGFGYHKEARVHAGFSMMTVAAFAEVKNGKLKKIRVAIGAGIGLPSRATALEELLEDQAVDTLDLTELVAKGTAKLPWKGKEGMSNEYAGHLGRVIVVDVLTAALRQAKGE
jgi:CO/xanthine dehydrogenase FAD-binding subunit